jgi:hypothetical protein
LDKLHAGGAFMVVNKDDIIKIFEQLPGTAQQSVKVYG